MKLTLFEGQLFISFEINFIYSYWAFAAGEIVTKVNLFYNG